MAVDLSLVPWEDIQAEMNRRFPIYVIAFVHAVEGQGEGIRYALGGARTGALEMRVGMTACLHKIAEQTMMQNFRDIGPGTPPLDQPR